MKMIDDGFGFGGGLAVGVAATVIVPLVGTISRMAWPMAREVIKGTIKTGLWTYEGVKVLATEAKETFDDIAAEADAEMMQSRRGRTASSMTAAIEADATRPEPSTRKVRSASKSRRKR